jgi:8-oxo-dGTP pyrophosphatase MutT (NUDIX family)
MGEEFVRIYKYGLVVIESNRLLLCKPYAFDDLILPGGTKDGDENHVENLVREVEEELGAEARLNLRSLQYLGNFEDIAAGRTYRRVEIEAYTGELSGDLKASSEIKSLVWFSTNDNLKQLSPIIRNKILPFLIANHLLI